MWKKCPENFVNNLFANFVRRITLLAWVWYFFLLQFWGGWNFLFGSYKRKFKKKKGNANEINHSIKGNNISNALE